MGDFEKGNEAESATHNPKPRLKAAIILILGLFAPLMMMMSLWGMFPDINIQSIFWMYSTSPYYTSFLGFSLMPIWSLFSMFPFLLFRMAAVLQIYRYYNGKTTRKRAAIVSTIGDGILLILFLPSIIVSIMFGMFFYIVIPLPIQMVVAFLILWRSPLPVPKTPWESEDKPKSWWEKTADSPPKKKPTDDDDVLW
jgi:hypothetical protein